MLIFEVFPRLGRVHLFIREFNFFTRRTELFLPEEAARLRSMRVPAGPGMSRTVLLLKKVKRGAFSAARPKASGKTRFGAKRQAVWLETRSVSD